MPLATNKMRLLALLLGLIFLAGQFHFCADVSLSGSGHPCPYCLTAGSFVATRAPVMGLGPTQARLESRPTYTTSSVEVLLAVSPRAPPSI
jgi:hypothetical protein